MKAVFARSARDFCNILQT